jgi:Spy/CpxP family protein refolding chaperone
MKRAHTITCTALLLIFFAATAFAQGRHQNAETSPCAPPGGASLERLDLTEEQRIAIQKIDNVYDDQIRSLQERLMSRKLELQSVFRDPQADEETLRAKAREVFDLQNECRNVAMDYQIEIRRTLTPEQIRNWFDSGDWSLPRNGGK